MSDPAPTATLTVATQRRAALLVLTGAVFRLLAVAVFVQARTRWYPQATLQ